MHSVKYSARGVQAEYHKKKKNDDDKLSKNTSSIIVAFLFSDNNRGDAYNQPARVIARLEQQVPRRLRPGRSEPAELRLSLSK